MRLILFLFLLVLACTNVKEEGSSSNAKIGFELLDSLQTGIRFTNRVVNSEAFNIFNYRNFYNGGGVAIGDINNDGLADVYITANMGANKLYLNEGDLKFRDITGEGPLTCIENWSTGVVMVDINNDDFLDIYVCNAGLNPERTAGQRNKLFINNHDLTFTERANDYGLDDPGYTTHIAFFDYDKDGDLDAYILNNSFIPVNTLNFSNKRELRAENWPVKDFLKYGGDKLLRNDHGHFKDVSEQANIYGSLIGFGLGVNIGDLNDDNYPDIYVSNDFFEKDYLYINQRDGTFKEELENRINHLSMSSMGADIADINNDGYPEIFTTDMLPYDDIRLKTTSSYDNIDVQNLRKRQGFYDQYMQNALQLNNKDGTFTEIAQYSGVAASDWSWGALVFDADNDMFSDIFVCNGIFHDVIDQDFIDYFANEVYQTMALSGEKVLIDEIINKMPSNAVQNVFFKSEGGLKFSLKSKEYGLSEPTFSNGAAYGDLDNDGDLDLLVNNVNQPFMVYRNNLKGPHYIKFKLLGDSLNRFSIGAKLKLYVDGQVIMREVIPSRGFQSSVDYVQTIGVGKNLFIDSLKIIWPAGQLTNITKPINVDTTYTVDLNNAKYDFKVNELNPISLLLKLDSTCILSHIENDYLDFYYEPNLPQILSREGPAVATADLDHDGLDDVFVGGAKGQVSKIYHQSKPGIFYADTTDVFDRFSYFEDVAAVFADVNGDGYPDLIVGGGGNEGDGKNIELAPRLFINQSNGVFKIENRLPLIYINVSVILPWDYDADGDVDLFIGARNETKIYGLSPTSYLLENNGQGYFTASNSAESILKILGCVRDASLVDIDNDKIKEIVVVGDWMYPVVLKTKGKTLVEFKTNLSNYSGMYGAILDVDFDQDGDRDLVLGNMGLNFNLKSDGTHPLKLFIEDFDNNETIDKILTRSIGGIDKPVFLKREIIQQIASLKKQNLKHSVYAQKSIYDLFDKEVMKKADVKTVTELGSYLAINEGKGKFKIQYLPQEAQWSNISCMAKLDIDKDGVEEILIGGNNYGTSSNFTKQDAFHGVVLKRDNNGYTYLGPSITGYSVVGESKKIVIVNKESSLRILTFVNNGSPTCHQLKL